MSNLTSPNIIYQITPKTQKVGISEQKVLIIGQGQTGHDEMTVIKNVQLSEVDSKIGDQSPVSYAVKRFKQINEYTEVDVLPLAPGSEFVKAKGEIKVTGTALESKTISVLLGDDSFAVDVNIKINDTATQVATSIKDAIIEAAKKVPFTAEIDSTDNTAVLLTYNFAGLHGNNLQFRFSDRVNGLRFDFSKTEAGVGVLDAIFFLQQEATDTYQTIIFDSFIKVDTFLTWLTDRAQKEGGNKAGSAFMMIGGSGLEISKGGEKLDNRMLTVFANPDEMNINAIPLLFVAEFAAKRTLRLREGAPLGDLVLSPNEKFGGVSKVSLPYHNTPMSYKPPLKEISEGRVEQLEKLGFSMVVKDGNRTTLRAVQTMEKKEPIYRYLNAVDTALAIREYLYKNSKKRFGQSRITEGSLVPDAEVQNETSIKGALSMWYVDMANLLWVEDGADALADFKSNLNVDLDLSKGICTVKALMKIMPQFRGLKGTVSITYDI